jgi:hypothetical protein
LSISLPGMVSVVVTIISPNLPLNFY